MLNKNICIYIYILCACFEVFLSNSIAFYSKCPLKNLSPLPLRLEERDLLAKLATLGKIVLIGCCGFIVFVA